MFISINPKNRLLRVQVHPTGAKNGSTQGRIHSTQTKYVHPDSFSEKVGKICFLFLKVTVSLDVLRACLHERNKTNYDEIHGNHERFVYCPDAQYAPPSEPDLTATVRYPHRLYFRPDYKG